VPKERPKNLDLSTVKFPVTATASILHRVSGIIIFIALSILLFLLHCSLTNESGFKFVAGLTDGLILKFILWGTLTALAYHAIFGIRHMIQDLGHWEEMQSASVTAKFGFVLVVILSILAGVLVW
jgi:succinate dehydrogenase / fumarate reductase cytochrome b subunit